MNQKTIVMSIALFILIVAGMFAYTYMKKSELTPVPLSQNDAQADEDVMYASITRITAKHFFDDGLHTFAGEIPMPTPCDLIDVSSRVMESFPEQVVLDFTAINNAEFCAQVITNQRFKVTASASEEAVISATFMGREVELNLVPPAEGESPEDFELFVKG